MARPPKLGPEQREVLRDWARRYWAVESPDEMAMRLGVSRATVDRYLHGYDPDRHTVSEFDSARSNGEFCRKRPHNGAHREL